MTEELKKALESAKTVEDKKAVAEKFKDELKALSEDELKTVAGGAGWMEEMDKTNPEVNIYIH